MATVSVSNHSKKSFSYFRNSFRETQVWYVYITLNAERSVLSLKDLMGLVFDACSLGFCLSG